MITKKNTKKITMVPNNTISMVGIIIIKLLLDNQHGYCIFRISQYRILFRHPDRSVPWKGGDSRADRRDVPDTARPPHQVQRQWVFLPALLFYGPGCVWFPGFCYFTVLAVVIPRLRGKCCIGSYRGTIANMSQSVLGFDGIWNERARGTGRCILCAYFTL